MEESVLLRATFHLKLIFLAESPNKKLKLKIQTQPTTSQKNNLLVDLGSIKEKVDQEDKEIIKKVDLEDKTTERTDKEDLEDKIIKETLLEEMMVIENQEERITMGKENLEEITRIENQIADLRAIENREEMIMKEAKDKELNGQRFVPSNQERKD